MTPEASHLVSLLAWWGWSSRIESRFCMLRAEDEVAFVVIAVLFAALSAWQILTTPDPSKVAVQLVLAAGMAALAGVLLFGRELQRIVAGSLYLALVLGLVVWLVLAFGVAQWRWGLLPP
jgi:hypothetical protein